MKKNLHTRVCIAESLDCTLETNTTLSINYISIKKFDYKKMQILFPSASVARVCVGPLCVRTSQVALVVKNPPANAGNVRDSGSIPGLGRSPGGGPGNPLQCSSLENLHGQRSLADYSPWSGRVRHDWNDLACTHAGLLHTNVWSDCPSLLKVMSPRGRN